MGRNARARSLSFGWDTVAERYAELVHAVAGDRDRTRHA
jgi:hypothetical protein